VALWLAGCATTEHDAYFGDVKSRANVFVAPVPTPIKKIAIMPFKAQTELIGTSVSDLFVTEMLRAGRYELVERAQMAKVLSESELALAGLSASRATEVGNMLGAEGVVIGTVDEYATVAQSGHPYPVVAITVRLIDCTSGKVMWSSDLAKRADSKDTTLPEQARAVTHEIVAGLYNKWHVQPWVAAAGRKGGGEPATPPPTALVGRGSEPPPARLRSRRRPGLAQSWARAWCRAYSRARRRRARRSAAVRSGVSAQAARRLPVAARSAAVVRWVAAQGQVPALLRDRFSAALQFRLRPVWAARRNRYSVQARPSVAKAAWQRSRKR
jgi:TolB-like protein